MPSHGPSPISSAEYESRLRRIRRIARSFGFTGRIEYRHVFSGSGGAQFALASSPEEDLLILDAEAFLRNSKRDDFSLEAMIAHERGHQIVCRNNKLQELFGRRIAPATEEILASLAGSWLVKAKRDRQSLVFKAVGEALKCGLSGGEAAHLIKELRALMEHMR